MKLPLKALISVICAFLLITSIPPPAMAHDSNDGRDSRYLGPNSTQCLDESAGQNHGRPAYPTTYSRYVMLGLKNRTEWLDYLGFPCVNDYYQPYGWMHLRGTVYKNGVFCVAGGWVFNTTYTSRISVWINEDIWPLCNYGNGVYVNITHDVYYESWAGNDRNYWIYNEQRPFPTTSHCHCP